MDPLYKTRCNTMKMLQRAGCTSSQVYNPRGELTIKRNVPADARSIFLEPQQLSLNLRPGVNLVFSLKITTPRYQPDLTLETTAVPETVNITFKEISSENPMVFEVKVKADKCPSNDDSNQPQNKTGPWSVDIKTNIFPQSVNLDISLDCQCECLNKQELNSPACNGHGRLVCGVCLCQMPYSGSYCQTDSTSTMNDDYCRSGPNAPVCSGRGFCEEGFCICEKRQNPNEKYFGQFCECSNFDCPYNNGRICGGRGMCQCGQCICEGDWAGEDCSCTMDSAPCMAENQMICSGRGTCVCGRCNCEPPYTGPTCEFCPTCQNRCQDNASCVE
ncbi:integrin beta-1-like [Periophthalmus magnuspinnatus]|uniref:integrin beta-1-like n=1 Tax=Periophthalmus magnuspinnatus TaxID=409849 RepID=UPI0024365003|nr:integrin beta-1-like [Periophthalmus magnuspinnatus]